MVSQNTTLEMSLISQRFAKSLRQKMTDQLAMIPLRPSVPRPFQEPSIHIFSFFYDKRYVVQHRDLENSWHLNSFDLENTELT